MMGVLFKIAVTSHFKLDVSYFWTDNTYQDVTPLQYEPYIIKEQTEKAQ